MQDLTLEVGRVDLVHVDDAEGPHPRRGQVQGGRRAEAPRTEEKDLGVQQPLLAGLADLGQEEVAVIAVALLGRQRPGGAPVPALVLPAVEPAGHGGDVRVAELTQRLRRERRPDAAGAVHDDRAIVVADPALDLGLQVASGDVQGVGDGALLVLLGLPYVEEQRLTAAAVRLGRIHLVDGRLGLGEKLSESGHVCHAPASD